MKTFDVVNDIYDEASEVCLALLKGETERAQVNAGTLFEDLESLDLYKSIGRGSRIKQLEQKNLKLRRKISRLNKANQELRKSGGTLTPTGLAVTVNKLP